MIQAKFGGNCEFEKLGLKHVLNEWFSKSYTGTVNKQK